jgi:hypothetical protein
LESVAFTVAGRPVLVHSYLPGAVAALRATWEPALLPVAALGAGRGALAYDIDPEGRITSGEQAVGKSKSGGNVASLLEGELLARALADNRAFFQLHAGAVVFGQHLVLLLGEAGAGKSTFTREALKLGATYITDDSLICEPGRFRGVARTIHFDSVLESDLAGLPPYFRDCDVASSRFLGKHGETWVVPLWRHAFRTISFFNPVPQKVVVFQISQSRHSNISQLSPLERAAALLGASLSSASSDFRMVPEGPAFSLEWHDKPGELLQRALEIAEVPLK